VVRTMPVSVRTGSELAVTLQVLSLANVTVYAIEESVPAGWDILPDQISHSGQWDGTNRKVKWGPFFDAQNRQLSYALRAPPNHLAATAFSGGAVFDTVSVAISGQESLVLVANRVPVARNDSLQRDWDQPVTVPIAKLLGNDSDPDGDRLSLTNPPAASAQGAALAWGADTLTYTPAAGLNSSDSFTYTVCDGYGGSASATVTVTVAPPQPSSNIKQIVPQYDDGQLRSVVVRFAGVPGLTYRIEATVSLSPAAWVVLGQRIAAANGQFEFEDLDADQYPSRYYRSVGQ